MSANWCVGRCERTGEKGDFPAETVYVLPAVTKPPSDILVSSHKCHALTTRFYIITVKGILEPYFSSLSHC